MNPKKTEKKQVPLELSEHARDRSISNDGCQNARKMEEPGIVDNEKNHESFTETDKNDVKNNDLSDLMNTLNIEPLTGANNEYYSNISPNISNDNQTTSFTSLMSEENKKLSLNRNNVHYRNNVYENGRRISGANASNNEGSSTINNINIIEKIPNAVTNDFTSTTTNNENHAQNSQLINVSTLNSTDFNIEYKDYESELQMQDIMRLIQAELSEPYSIYTYRYFIYNWPKLCFLAAHNNEYVGAIVCKLDMHLNVIKRGYIAMLAVKKEYRKMKIGTNLVQKAIEAMLADEADEVVLETEMKNIPALRLYENLGFVRDKRLFRYYLNGVDALRLKLWFR